MTISFWMEHSENPNDNYTNYATSVAEIERLTGFDFFANLPADIQAASDASKIRILHIRIVLNGRKDLRHDTKRHASFYLMRVVLYYPYIRTAYSSEK